MGGNIVIFLQSMTELCLTHFLPLEIILGGSHRYLCISRYDYSGQSSLKLQSLIRFFLVIPVNFSTKFKHLYRSEALPCLPVRLLYFSLSLPPLVFFLLQFVTEPKRDGKKRTRCLLRNSGVMAALLSCPVPALC